MMPFYRISSKKNDLIKKDIKTNMFVINTVYHQILIGYSSTNHLLEEISNGGGWNHSDTLCRRPKHFEST